MRTVGNSQIKRISLLLLAGFYLFAGFNHFRDPAFYLALIPPFFPFPEFINVGSGILEMLLGVLILIPNTRKWAAYSIIVMLVAFIPSHVFFIQEGSCLEPLCVDPWIGWMRLVVIHPALIFWAYWHRT